MNAHALLRAQGWRGTGHSLHKTDDSIGLAKPLLLNRKDNKKGLGQTQHFTSDQWWMNAFDEQLKGLDTSKEGKVIQTVKTGKLNALDKGALSKYSVYATFVRGGFLQGTLSTPELTDGSSVSDKSDENEAKSSAMGEPSSLKEKTKDKKKNKEDSKERKERKEKKKQEKEAKRQRKEEKALRKASRAARRERKAARAARRAMKTKSDPTSNVGADEEKRRRRAKKEEKRRLGKSTQESEEK